MKWQFEEKSTNGRFTLSVGDSGLKGEGLLNGKKEMINTIVLNTGLAQQVTIDGITYNMPGKSVLPLVANQHFVFEKAEELIAWQFNRDFYCIMQHDAEVGCVGFLFYGIRHPFFISLTDEEVAAISLIQQLCLEDMIVHDTMQGEMLRTLLKRLIIRVTRIGKKQTVQHEKFTEDKNDLIRNFNLLLECNYKTQHEVRYYAQVMNKSPKTLCNLFAICNYDPPSKCIQNRIVLEAKRYLNYTDKSAKEVADALGFVSTAHFSKFFKNNAGCNFSKFR